MFGYLSRHAVVCWHQVDQLTGGKHDMYLGRELLLSLVIVVHVSFLDSRPTESPDQIAQLRERMEHLTSLPFENLMMIKQDYDQHVFGGQLPEELRSDTLEPLEGIVLPVGDTTEEVEGSICSISDYLTVHLPAIVRSHVLQPHRDQLLNNAAAFYRQFERAANLSGVLECHRNVTTDWYDMKVTGFKIIHFTKKWVEDFTDTPAVADR